MSQTLRVLKLTPETFDGDSTVEGGVGDVLGGMNRLMLGIVALRKSQGVGPHGRDALEAVLDADYAVITANAVDAAAALLYRLHRKQAESDPLKRMRFGDYPDFDKLLDDKNPDLFVEEIPLQASKALYSLEFEQYQQMLREFLEDRPAADDDLGFEPGEMVAEEADG
ncbi:MAG: abortive infection family protein [Phycisphaerales bacterium]